MENGVVTLRKLTEKSKLGIGKFRDLTIENLIDVGRISYLTWVYYNVSSITFTDDILERIHIPQELRIAKPGVSLEMSNASRVNKIEWYKSRGCYTDAKEKFYRNNGKRKKKLLEEENRRYRTLWGKASMAWKNQGH